MFFPERHLQKTACFTSPAGKKLMLEDGTQLGRQDSPKRTRDNLPKVFERAHKAVNLGPDPKISRNHALLLKEDGKWTIYDLNSRDGTYVNGVRIRPGEGVALKRGDRVNIGLYSNLIFSDDYPTKNAALLVGKPGFPYLKGVKKDLEGMRAALLGRDFEEDNVISIYGWGATKSNVLCAMDSLRSVLSRDSLFIFYYSGHGGRDGLALHPLLADFSMKHIFGPGALFDAIRDLDGKKLVLLDSCNASVFLDDVPYRTMVLTGESPDGHLFDGEASCNLALPVHLQKGGPRTVQGLLTHAFLKAISGHDGHINLKKIVDRIESYKQLARQKVEVFAEGNTVILPSVLSLKAAVRTQCDDRTHVFDLRDLLGDSS